MIFDKILKTNKKSYGINSKEYIILHHTGGGDFNGMMEFGANGDKQVSWHYTIGINGEIGKIGEDSDILWHAGDNTDTKLNGISYYNGYSIGIEVVSNGKNFSIEQKLAVKQLVKYLQSKYNIPYTNILRHLDITNRKWDIGDNFWNREYNTYKEYIKNNFKKMEKLSNPGLYKKIDRYNLFSTSEEDYNRDLTAGDIKDLIEIGLYRADLKRNEGNLLKR